MPDLKLGLVEPQQAVAAFERRGQLQPSFRWQDVWAEEHGRAFAVAGVMRLDVLQVFRDEVEAALRTGGSLADFRKALVPQLVAKGFWGDVEVADPATQETRVTRFDERRLQLIFDMNLRQSYTSGQWEAIERNRARLPLVGYVTMRDERVRASHRAWDGVILPIDDPWWDGHTPPCGWRCRCRVVAMTEKDVARRQAAGLPVKLEAPPDDPAPYVNPRTGEVAPVPRGVDPGFGYRKGRGSERDAQLYDSALRKALASYPLPAATAVAQAVSDYPVLAAVASRRFGRWVDRLRRAPQPGAASGELRFVGTLAPGAVRALEAQGVGLSSAVLAVTDADVLRALQGGVPGAIAPAVYRRLPELLARAQALVRDTQAAPPVLLYLVELTGEDGAVSMLAMELAPSARAAGAAAVSQIKAVSLLAPEVLRDRARYSLLWGRLP